MLEIVTGIVTALIMLYFAFWYSLKVFKKSTSPALSTWLIMLSGTTLSLITYLVSSDGNVLSGVLNLADTLVSILIVGSIIYVFGLKTGFKPFEKWYLLVCAIIVAFWIISNNAFVSNLLIQLLILVGYIPTIHKMISKKRNTESFFVWSLALTASIISLIPAVLGKELLAMIYVGRSITVQIIIILVMKKYK